MLRIAKLEELHLLGKRSFIDFCLVSLRDFSFIGAERRWTSWTRHPGHSVRNASQLWIWIETKWF